MLFITQTALELGFMYALVSMALFLSYRVLDIADLTTDGTFVLGMAVSVSLAAAGHPFLAIPAAMAAGACAGFVTAFLQTRLGVPSILAGIVTNTGLYTINLMAMGWSSNVNLLKQETIFSLFRATGIGGDWYELIIAAVITIAAGLVIIWLLGTRLGLSIRATGDNRDMVRAAVKALNLEPLAADACASSAVTAVKKPGEIDVKQITKIMRDKYNIIIAAGQGKLDKSIFRIGHLGYVNDADILATIACLEMTLKELGWPCQLGAGVAAVQKMIMEGSK